MSSQGSSGGRRFRIDDPRTQSADKGSSRFHVHETIAGGSGDASVDRDGAAERVRVGPLQFTVSFKDTSREFQVEVTADFIQSGQRQTLASALSERFMMGTMRLAGGSRKRTPTEELSSVIIQLTRALCRQNLTLQDFCFNHTVKLEEPLRASIADAARANRRELQRLSVIPRVPAGWSEAPRELLVQRPYTIALNQSITVISKIILEMREAGRYAEAGSPPIKDWLERVLDSTLARVLFSEQRSGLLMRWPDIAARIREDVSSQGLAIGYRINAIISEPSMPEWEWVRPFDLDIDNGQRFETTEDGVLVPMRIIAALDSIDLERNAEAIDQQRDLISEMRTIALGEARRYLRGVSPERYHMHFDSVSSDIEQRVRKALRDQFSAKVRQVSVIPLPTPQSRRLQELLAQPVLRLSPVVTPVGDPKIHSVTVVVDLQITAVSEGGWGRFSRVEADVEQIADGLTKHLEALLQTAPTPLVAYRTETEHTELDDLIRKTAQKAADDRFGLSVKLVSVTRSRTALESRMNTLHDEDFDERVKEAKHRYALRQVDRESELAATRDRGQAQQARLAVLREQQARLMSQIDREADREEELTRISKQLAEEEAKATGTLKRLNLVDLDDHAREQNPALPADR